MYLKFNMGACLMALGLSLGMGMSAALAGNAPSLPGLEATLPSTLTVTGTQTIASVGGCSRVDVNITGPVTGTNDLGGGLDRIRLALWDDGIEEDFAIVTIPVGQTVTINVNLGFEGLYGTGAPGIGVFVYDGPDSNFGALLLDLDPFFPTDIAGSCGPAAAPISVPVDAPWALLLLTMMMLAIGLSFGSGLRRD